MNSNKLDSMFQLTKNFQEVFDKAIMMTDENGVLTDEAINLMDSAAGDIVSKTGNIFGVKVYIEGQIQLLKDSKKYIDGKKKILEKNLDQLRKLFALGLDTAPLEVDKNGKKTQKIKSPFGTAFYKFGEDYSYQPEEIEDKYKKTRKKYSPSESFSFEKLFEIAPDMVKVSEENYTDYQSMIDDHNNGNTPKGMTIIETKSLNLRK